jgi:CheY-like chemotaxis protein/signal transduction histidine kinase/CHASE3 domain sensor protein
MKLSLDKKILAGFIVSAIILIAVAIYSFSNSEKFAESATWVSHTQEVRYEFQKILADVVDAEAGERGYIITGNESYLKPYNYTKANLLAELDRVRELVRDNQIQQKNVDTIKLLANQSLQYLEKAISARKTIGLDSARAMVQSGGNKVIVDHIRSVLANAENLENVLLIQRNKASNSERKNFIAIFIVLISIIAIVLFSVYLIITANLKALRKAEKEASDRNWNLTGSGELIRGMQGNLSVNELCQIIINQIASYLDAAVGAIYLLDETGTHLTLAGGYGLDHGKQARSAIKANEGIAGQAASDNKKIILENVPDGYLDINSGLGSTAPRNIMAVPFAADAKVKGIIELGTLNKLTALQSGFLELVADSIATAVGAAQDRYKSQELLEETQRQSEELQLQQEELRQTNEELQQKTEQLERSEAELKTQQDELQKTNEELEEKAELLEEQKRRLENAKIDIEDKARELEITSKYKSEFLANMSHELRTPLNSILILSHMLSENKNKKLGEKEAEYARSIHNSGSDLLNLINEILDLAKIESGKIELDISTISCREIKESLSSTFTQLAKTKGIEYAVNIQNDDLAVTTDRQRLEQILKNFLSNAFKFTEKGGKVTLYISRLSEPVLFRSSALTGKTDILSFSVTDTGIGIPEDKQELIFEAFQQADGSTRRKYGGTGLGLSISRELCHALGGEIHVVSETGKGSAFTLYLPAEFDTSLVTAADKKIEIKKTVSEREERKNASAHPEAGFGAILDDDSHNITENDKIVLIIEDDDAFSTALLDFVRQRHYKGVIAKRGSIGVSFARHYKPDAILLDIKLPTIDGLEVLKQLKHDPELRHIPVQILSGYDKKKEGMELGAFDFMKKPVTLADLQQAFDKIEGFIEKKIKKLLIVEDNKEQNQAICELIGNGDVKCYQAHSGNEALMMLARDGYDCIILDIGLPDISGFELLEAIKETEPWNQIPVIIYTGRELKKDEAGRLNRFANAIILKTASSQERLLDETTLFLHRVESRLPKEKQKMIRKLHSAEDVLLDKKILVVDDDMRNIYSLTSALEQEGLQCVIAENGKEAMAALDQDPAIDLVLMDIMMPEMDGYETTREIRKNKTWEKLPVIALTAKAMKEDKEKCLAAGMSDYISKPVNIEQLLSLMRVWLYK